MHIPPWYWFSDAVRNELWQNLLDVNRMCRYYESVHSKNTFGHFFVRVTTLVLISGGVTAALDLIPGNDSQRHMSPLTSSTTLADP